VVLLITEPAFSGFLEVIIGVANLIYLYNRQGIYGIQLKNSKCPVIHLPEETDLSEEE
jgi:hypothetical protein